MKRLSALLLLGAFLACSGEAADEEAVPAPGPATAAAAPSADEAALDEVTASFEEHYNMHHASVVADLYTDSAFFLSADGAVHEGKAAILASMEADMATSPTLDLMTDGRMVFGDMAVTRGTYTHTAPVEGAEPVSTTGTYMTLYQREGDTWKIGSVITNFHAPPPEGFAYQEPGGDPPPEASSMTELNAAWMQHFNLGHADMTAEYHTEDGFVAPPNGEPVTGRAAIAAAFAEMMAEGSPQITLHGVGTFQLAEGWALDGGWYEMSMTTPEGPATFGGTYMALVRQQPDGSWKLHWDVANGHPTGM